MATEKSSDMVLFSTATDDEPMKTTDDWQAQAKGMIRGGLKRRNLSYKDLADRLEAIGVKDTERNIANKISRGGFTAVFFLQCLEAIGVNTLHLNGD
ncbi:MAG: DUF6471 domain-containing protein [Alphaproteobacteria bacterium]